MRADMHLHSCFSDGRYPIAEVFERAEKSGVEFIAVSDHDVICPPALLEEAAKKTGLKYVPAIEISAYSGDVKIHLLCYNPDLENSDFRNFLSSLSQGSFERAEDILFRLKRCGVNISLEEAAAKRADKNSPIHAMHIARAGAEKGYARDEFEFYFNFLAHGKEGFSTVARPTPEYATEVSSAAGGLVSLAHPARIDLDKNAVKRGILRLQSCGLKGIEAIYSAHTELQTAYYKEMAKEYGLFITGGSDTHFDDGRHFIGVPEFYPEKELLHTLGTSE